jgi:hypothetical protein
MKPRLLILILSLIITAFVLRANTIIDNIFNINKDGLVQYYINSLKHLMSLFSVLIGAFTFGAVWKLKV